MAGVRISMTFETRIVTADLSAPVDADAESFLRTAIGGEMPAEAISFEGGQVSVAVRQEPGLPSDEQLAAQLERLIAVSRSLDHDVVFDHCSGRAAPVSPDRVLAVRGDLLSFGPGLFRIEGPFLQVMQGADRIIEQLAQHYGAVEHELPALWPVDLLCLTNVFAETPEKIILCTNVKQDRMAQRAVAGAYSQARVRKQGGLEVSLENFWDDARMGFQPALSLASHYAFQERGAVQDCVYTAKGKVSANGAPRGAHIREAAVVTRREIMAVGSERYVTRLRERWLDDIVDLLTYIDIDCRIETAPDSLMGNNVTLKQVFQHASKLKYRVLADLPHLEEQATVMELALHLDAYSKIFNYTLEDGSPAYSGLLSVDLEPLTYALMSQFGAEVEGWPDRVRSTLGV